MDGDTLAVSLAEAPLEALSGEGLAVLPVGVVLVDVPTPEGAPVTAAAAVGREIGASVAPDAEDTSTHTPSRYS